MLWAQGTTSNRLLVLSNDDAYSNDIQQLPVVGNADEIVAEEDTIAVDNIETAERRRARSEAQQKERIVLAPCVNTHICSGRCER